MCGFVRFTTKNVDALFNFERVSDCASEWLIHVGQQRARFDATGITSAHECMGQLSRPRFFPHERAVAGFITRVDTTEIGHAIAAIGGGRVRIEDTVDPTVGFTSELKLGEQVSAGEAIGTVYCADASAAAEAARRIQAAYHVDDAPPNEELKLVKEIINE